MGQITLAVLFLAFTGSLFAKGLEVGAQAPQVTALDQDGNPIDLAKELSKGTTVVFFYPMADTPGCTKQACSLGEGFFQLAKEAFRFMESPETSPRHNQNSKQSTHCPIH